MIVGIDENGLGPVLGPLIVTGSLFRYTQAPPAEFTAEAFHPLHIQDSKKVFSQRDKSGGERAVLALTALVHGTPLHSSEKFLDRFTAHGTRNRQSCPGEGGAMCWNGGSSLPLWDRKDSARSVEDDAGRLSRSLSALGLKIVDVRAEVCCARDFNDLLREAGGNKARVNFLLFERVIRYFHEKFGHTALFACGKNMGTRKYGQFFSYLSRFPLISQRETPGISTYRFEGLGEVRFLQDGEDMSLPIAVSSLFGKYIREIFVARQNAYVSRRVPGHTPVSGYRDRVTKTAIKRIGNPEETLGISRDCFFRQK